MTKVKNGVFLGYNCVFSEMLQSSYDTIMNICGYCEIFAKTYGILVTTAILVNNAKRQSLSNFYMLFVWSCT
jgi:hypothetical protein